MAKNTITDVMEKLGAMEERIDQNQRLVMLELTTIKAKQDHTNGDVNDLKKDKLEREIKEKTLKEIQHDQVSTVNVDTVNVNKWPTSDQVKAAVFAILVALGGWLSGGGNAK